MAEALRDDAPVGAAIRPSCAKGRRPRRSRAANGHASHGGTGLVMTERFENDDQIPSARATMAGRMSRLGWRHRGSPRNPRRRRFHQRPCSRDLERCGARDDTEPTQGQDERRRDGDLDEDSAPWSRRQALGTRPSRAGPRARASARRRAPAEASAVASRLKAARPTSDGSGSRETRDHRGRENQPVDAVCRAAARSSTSDARLGRSGGMLAHEGRLGHPWAGHPPHGSGARRGPRSSAATARGRARHR